MTRIVFKMNPDRNVFENTFTCNMKYEVVGDDLLNEFTAVYTWDVSFMKVSDKTV